MKSKFVPLLLTSFVSVSGLAFADMDDFPDGIQFGSEATAILPLGTDLFTWNEAGAIKLYSSAVNTPTTSGGIVLQGAPIKVFLGDGVTPHGKFEIWPGAIRTTPMFQLDTYAETVVFNDLDIDVNSGTLKVGGYPVLTSVNGSLSVGGSINTTGLNASGFGLGSKAQGYNQFVVGQYNVAQGTGTANSNYGDALFIVGNGSSDTSRSNALTIERSGVVRMAGPLVVGSGSNVTGFKANAIGEATAEGNYSVALGLGYTAPSATYSVALGNSLTYGQYSASMGNSSANANYATATGNSMAYGEYSLATGKGTVSYAYASTAIGSYNTYSGSTTSWAAGDDVFIIGNGTSDTARSNALVVKKNGSLAVGKGTTIGTVPTGSSQIVVGVYNDTSTDTATEPDTVRGAGVFTVGAGTSSTPKNAIRVTTSGKVLVQPSGEISMGAFTAGEKP